MNEKHDQDSPTGNNSIQQTKSITDPKVVSVLHHEKKQILLKLLIKKEMSIMDLKNATDENPGTVKRHLTDLVNKGLIVQTRIEKNIYGIKVKYYRATARQFVFNIKWPEEEI